MAKSGTALLCFALLCFALLCFALLYFTLLTKTLWSWSCICSQYNAHDVHYIGKYWTLWTAILQFKGLGLIEHPSMNMKLALKSVPMYSWFKIMILRYDESHSGQDVDYGFWVDVTSIPEERWYQPTRPHGVTTQKTTTDKIMKLAKKMSNGTTQWQMLRSGL
jgi:hypothetical protein